MSSRLLKDLEARAAEARTEDERLQIRAEMAGALARMGRISEARDEISRLRALNSQYSPSLTAWILLAEGLIEHFAAMGPAPKDRYRRAYAIAASVGDKRLRGLAAAWLASWELNNGDIFAAVDKSVESICDGADDDHATLCRSYLVLAGCLEIADEVPEAARYFSLARARAVDGGDIGMQSVILHNFASGKLNRLTIEHAFGVPPSEEPRRIALELQSFASLESGIGHTTLKAGTGLVMAQLHVCTEQWSDALSLFASNFDDSLNQGHERWRARSLADMALCLGKLGDTDGAIKMANRSIECIDLSIDSDDLAVTHARLAATFEIVGDETARVHHDSKARSHLNEHRAYQARLRAALMEALERIAMRSSNR